MCCILYILWIGIAGKNKFFEGAIRELFTLWSILRTLVNHINFVNFVLLVCNSDSRIIDSSQISYNPGLFGQCV